MKITKRELKELLREQVKTVVDEVWIKVGDDEPPLPSHSEHGPYAPEEGEDDEWPEASWEQDQSWRDEARDIEGRPQEEEPEALRLPNPWDAPGGPKAFTKRVGARFRGEPEEPGPEEPEEKKYGHVYWDEEEGRNKVRKTVKKKVRKKEEKR